MDPYDQFASPYIGMGDDPMNGIDPSGGAVFDNIAADLVVGAVGGAIIGGVVGALTGNHNDANSFFKGAAIGAGAGLAIMGGIDFLGTASQQALQHAGHIAERIALDGFRNVIMASSQGGGLKSYSWASKWKWQVHQYANKIAVFQNSDWNEDEKTDKLRRDKLKALDDGTVEADSDPNQTGDNSYKHAMRNGDKNQSIKDARDKADKYVREKFSIAIKLLNTGNLYEAYRTFALGLHTLQDATSPAHHGFQKWSDHPGWQSVYNHISQEFMYPGQGSNLQMITNKYLSWLGRPCPQKIFF